MKKGIDLGLTVVSRDGKNFVRRAHNATNSHNKARQDCMKQQLSGKHFGSREAQIAAFRSAAHACR